MGRMRALWFAIAYSNGLSTVTWAMTQGQGWWTATVGTAAALSLYLALRQPR